MKIVVIGGSGLIGSKLVSRLREHGHDVVVSLRGARLPDGASTVIDVSDEDVVNLLAAEEHAGVDHHVALSVVGAERLTESGCFPAKHAQDQLIRHSSIPYSIVHATQCFECIERIATAATVGDTVRLPPALIQPVAADDVAAMVGRVAVGPPLHGSVEIAGPDRFRLDALVRRWLSVLGDPREVIADPDARYFGARLTVDALLPDELAQLAETHFEDWLD